MKFAHFNLNHEMDGRYDTDLCGPPSIVILDPSWVRPTIQVPQDDGNGGTIMGDVPDETAVHPTVTMPNPDCKIPADAVEVSDETYYRSMNETDGVWKRDPETGYVAKHPFPLPSLESIKATKSSEINAACASAIVGGFASSALGAPHIYDSALEDQLNLIGAVSLGADLPYRCADAAGIKAFRLHTAAQLKQVAADGALVKLAALEKAAMLKAQVQAAADAATVEAVAW